MMPIYRRRRRLSKRTRSRSSFRVPFDPRVLRLRPSSATNVTNLLRAALVAIPARIRQARSEVEEVNKRLEIFSELNDAYQTLIESMLRGQSSSSSSTSQPSSAVNLTEVASSSTSTTTTTSSSSSSTTTQDMVAGPSEEGEQEEEVESLVIAEAETFPALKIETITTDEMLEMIPGGDDDEDVLGIVVESEDDDQSLLETEIIYDFVV